MQGVRVTHPEKVLWPDDGITKLDLVRYYQRIAPVLLPYALDRPLTLRPFPHGVDQPGFYLKSLPRGAPSWLETFDGVAQSTGETVRFVVARDSRTLIWLAQYNAPEVHAWLSRVDRPELPDWAVLDLDAHGDAPGGDEVARWRLMVRATAAVRQGLERLGLRAFPKLSGQSGIHLLVPLARDQPYDAVRAFFQALAEELCASHPDLLTRDYGLKDRLGRVLIDYAQNAYGKTTVAPYSVRPRPGAPVAAPVTWDELDDPRLHAGAFTIHNIFERLERAGDVLAPALALRQRLPPSGTHAA